MSAVLVALLVLAQLPSEQGGISVHPGRIVLRDPWDSQRLVISGVARAGSAPGGDGLKVSIEPPGLAEMNDGLVIPLRNGKGILRVRSGPLESTVPLEVSGQSDGLVPDFKGHVEPALTGLGCNSGACHGALAGKGGLKLSLRAYDSDADHSALVFQMLGRRIDRHDASRSLMVLKALGDIPHGGGRKLAKNSPEHRMLVDWIAKGAPKSSPAAPPIAGLEIIPPVSRMSVGETNRILVMARLQNGGYRDVSRLAKFASAQESVAGVGADGIVTATGHGEAAISAMFNNMVAVSRTQIPFAVAQGKVENFKPNNWIDQALASRWAELNIKASGPISDEEFLRRLWLDCLGTLPTPGQLSEFRADNKPGKRDRWIEKALESPEYVDYWTYKWAELFLVRSGRLQQSAVWAFHDALKKSVRSGQGWDTLSREILLARGSTLRGGLGNFYSLHRDPAELAEAVAVTFLGQSIGCAKCHNHPMEKWTQDQYWSFVNLFGRVGLKSGELDGEMLVAPLAVGDVPHLRTGRAMPPTPLDGPSLSLVETRDRRAHLTGWLLSPDNPFFARAQVNRIWRHFFSRGLVEPDDDLRQTNPSVLEGILTRLAADFRAAGHDNKAVIRAILRSSAYQLSSSPSPNNQGDDQFFSRYLPRRLPAEVLLDAYSQVTGVPTLFDGVTPGGGNGTTKYSGYPLGTRSIQLPDAAVSSPFLDSFGRPERLQACSCERTSETGVSQVLQMANGSALNGKISSSKGTVADMIRNGDSAEKMVVQLFRSALTRDPEPRELASFTARVASLQEQKRREWLEDCFWAVLSSKEFLLNH